MYIAIANAIYSSLLQGSRGGFPQACFGLDYNAITSDFTFTRNSFATRVNEFGLIETVTDLGSDLIQNGSFDELGSELITNGDFENGETDWGFGGDWTLVNGTAEILTSTNSFLVQSNVIPLTVKTYKIQYEVVTTNGSNFRVAGGNSAFGTVTLDSATVGVKTVYLTSNGTKTNLQFNQNAFRGSIDNVSVKEVGQDWTLGTGWSVDQANSKATCDGTQTSTSTLQTAQGISNIQNDLVKLSFEIKDYSAGAVSVTLQGTGGIEFNNLAANGVYEINVTSTDSLPRLLFNANSSFVGSVTNISVQEVLEDDVPRIDYTGSTFDVPVLGDELIDYSAISSSSSSWSLVNGKWFFDDTTSGFLLTEVFDVVVGEQYEITVDVSIASGNANFRVTSGNAQTRVFNYTDFPNGVTKFITTVEGVDGAVNRIFAPTSLTDNPFTLNSISIKKVTAYTTTDKGAFLLEPISTNLITESNLLVAISGGIVTPNAAISPDGTINAIKVNFGTGSNSGGTIYVGGSSASASTEYTISFYAKNFSGDGTFRLRLDTDTQTALVNETFVATSEWVKYTHTFTTDAAAASFSASSRFRKSTTADNNEVLFFGIQLEQQSYSTSYIPTSGATVTRAQESCIDATPTINSEEGVLYAEIAALADDLTNRYITISDGSNSNYIRLVYSTTSNQLGARYYVNGSFQCALTYILADETEFIKAAFKWKENDFALWVNGTEVATDTSGNVNPENTFYRLDFSRYDGIFPFYGRTKDLRVYCKALTDEQLIELTTI